MPLKRVCPFCANTSTTITGINGKECAQPVEIGKNTSPVVEKITEPVCVACGAKSARIGDTKNVIGQTEELWKCSDPQCGEEFNYAGQSHQCKQCFRYWAYTSDYLLSILKEHVEAEVYPAYPDPEDTRDVIVTIDHVLAQQDYPFYREDFERAGGEASSEKWSEKWEHLKERWGIIISWAWDDEMKGQVLKEFSIKPVE